MKYRLTLVLLALAVVLSLLAAQCVAPAPQTVVETVVVKEEVEKEVVVTKEVEKEVIVTVEVPVEAAPAEIVIAVPEEPPDLDWGYVGLSHLPITRNVYEMLVTRNGETGELEPQLAESWEQIDDTTWRFKLREGVTFHDGTPFNAEAAAWNINNLTNPELNKHVFPNFNEQYNATAVDEYTLEIQTSGTPDPVMARRLYWAHMASPTAVEADPDLQNMVGTGPYILDEWVKGEKVVLVANPDYWGGEPAIKKVTFVFRTESAVRAAMVQADEVDIAAWLAPQDSGPIRTLGANIPETPFMRMDPYPPLDDIRVRQAICMAMDRDAIAEKIFAGYAKPATQLITPDVIGYNPDIPLWPYDPEAARALIEEAKADGVPVDKELTIIGRKGIYPNATESMEILQAWLADIGLNVKLQMLETSAWIDQVLEKPQPPERLGLLQSSHGNEAGDGALTLMGYYQKDAAQNAFWDETMEELIQKARVAGEEERGQAVAEGLAYQRENILQDCPMVHIQALWGLSGRVDWTPRFDNLILVKDVSLK
jgi:peptide/nickel transport system substrate-binding protein